MGAVEALGGLWRRSRDRLLVRLAGLTDAEFFWSPVADAWTLRRDPDAPSGWRIDYDIPTPVPPPFTTLAWRLVHVASGNWIRWEHALGVGSRTFLDLMVPSDAAGAITYWQDSTLPITDWLATAADADLGRGRPHRLRRGHHRRRDGAHPARRADPPRRRDRSPAGPLPAAGVVMRPTWVVVAVLTLVGCAADQATPVAAPTPAMGTTATTPLPTPPLVCPADPPPTVEATYGEPGPLVRDGALSAALCRYDLAPSDVGDATTWQPPVQTAYDGDLVELVTVINAMPTLAASEPVGRPPRPRPCNLALSPRHRVLLGYSGGSQTVELDENCGTASRNDRVRLLAGDLVVLLGIVPQ